MARLGTIGDQYLDDAGDPLVSGKLYFYESGTTTPKNTYADVNLTIANTNPVVLSGAGRQPNVFFSGTAKVVLTDADTVQIEVRDPVGEASDSFGAVWDATASYSIGDVAYGPDGEYYKSLTNSNTGNTPSSSPVSWSVVSISTASELPFVPAGDIVATDVQAAIEELDAEKISAVTTPFEEFTVSGTWTKDANATYVYVEAIGGGGGGAGYSTAAFGVAAGGAGGDFNSRTYLASDLGATETVTIGLGGAGGVATAGISANGTAGGITVFSDTLAYGGKGGQGSGNTSVVQIIPSLRAGAGTLAFPDANTAQAFQRSVNHSMGGYGTGNSSPGNSIGAVGGTSYYGGGGGSGNVTTGSTTSLPGGVSQYAGDGGGTARPNGGSGTAPGGGGGGAADNAGDTQTGGAGADGRVRVWQW